MTARRDWKPVKFGDVVKDVKVTVDPETSNLERYVAGEHMQSDDLHIRAWGTIGDGYLGPAFHRKFVRGQVLYGSRRTYLRKVAWAEFDGICANTTFVLQPRNDRLIPELLPFIMQTERFTEHAIKNSRGSTNPYVNWKDIASYEFPLPPLDEQRRIAEIMRAADRVVETLRAFESAMNRFLTILLRDMAGKLSTNQFQLVKIAEISQGLTINPLRRELPNFLPYLRVANVMRGRLNLEEIKTIGVLPEEVEKYRLKRGDILVVEGHANIEDIGRAALWQGEIPDCLHQNHIFRVRCHDGVMPEFLLMHLNSPAGKAYFRRIAASTSGLSTINSQTLGKMPTPIVSIENQQVLIDTKRRLELVNSQLQAHAKLAISLKASLLEKFIDDGT